MASEIKSVRMSSELWALLDEVAKSRGVKRNALIVEILGRYCKKRKRDIDKGKKVC